jgi:hypothetical protein
MLRNTSVARSKTREKSDPLRRRVHPADLEAGQTLY